MKLGAIAVAVAVPVVGLGGVGFAGGLPDPVQEQFEGVVESVTPYKFSGPGKDPSEFGRRVSEDAEDGGVDGPEVSEEARDRGEERRNQGEERRPVDPEQGPPATPGPPDHVGEPPGNRPTDRPGSSGDQPRPSRPAPPGRP